MNIVIGKQRDIKDFNDLDVDIFLLAGNHEKRVFTAYEIVSTRCKIGSTIMFCYGEYQCQKKYDVIAKYKIVDAFDIYKILDDQLAKINKEDVVIFIDYSCMTKSWYYLIIQYFANKKAFVKDITSYFSYTPSKYSTPFNPKPNTEIAPLPGRYIVPTDKPKALIVCLGYESQKAEGIIDHLDPKISYIFYTKPALDKKFVTKVEENNKNIITNRSYNLITYPFDDLLYLERQLTSLYYLLKDDYSIIIAPLGPKPFAFIAMILSVKYRDVDIWRVGSGADINEYDRVPLKDKLIINEVVWSNN